MGDRLLLRGNEVIAEAAIRAGCQCYFAYPITPQAELLEHMAKNICPAWAERSYKLSPK